MIVNEFTNASPNAHLNINFVTNYKDSLSLLATSANFDTNYIFKILIILSLIGVEQLRVKHPCPRTQSARFSGVQTHRISCLLLSLVMNLYKCLITEVFKCKCRHKSPQYSASDLETSKSGMYTCSFLSN